MTSPPETPAGGVPAPINDSLASWGDRVVATLIDFIVVAGLWLVVNIVGWILGIVSDALGGLVALLGNLIISLYGLYLGFLEGEKGQSPGKALRGLKVIKEADGQLLGGGMGIVRKIAHAIDSFVCLLGYLLPLVDVKKQTIADKLLQTVVVKGEPPKSLGPDLFLP